MTLLIYTSDKDLAEQLTQSAPKGVDASKRKLTLLSADSPEILWITLGLAKDVAVGVFSAWLYDKIKGKSCHVEYRRKEIECDEKSIRRIVEEHISISDDK
jgi:hypothetical protein